MPDRSEGEPPEGGAVDDGWGDLLGDGGPAPAPSPAAVGSAAADQGEKPGTDEAETKGDAEEEAKPEVEEEAKPEAEEEAKPEAEEDAEPEAAVKEEAKPEAAEKEEAEQETKPEAEAKQEPKGAAVAEDKPEGGAEVDEEVVPSQEPLRPPAQRASSEGGSSWGFVGALVVAAALVGAWVLSTRNDSEPARAVENKAPPPETRRAAASVGRPVRADRAEIRKASAVAEDAQDTRSDPQPQPKAPKAPEEEEPAADPEAGKAAPAKAETPQRPDSSADPRAVPAGTPPEIARVFEGLPVTPTDRPPVGKIGKTGIHVDRISMGTEYRGGECSGPRDGFSIAKRQRANVCFRVVHDRYQVEQVRVLWQKDGGTVRRTKLSVPVGHAYRTRAFLVLRKEYAGRWTVRIMSADGIELASHAFTVVK